MLVSFKSKVPVVVTLCKRNGNRIQFDNVVELEATPMPSLVREAADPVLFIFTYADESLSSVSSANVGKLEVSHVPDSAVA